MKPAREPASSCPKPCAFLKKSHESCPFAAPCGPRRKKNDVLNTNPASGHKEVVVVSFTLTDRASTIPSTIRLYLHVSSSYHTVRDECWSAADAGQVRPPLAARSR